MPMTTFTTKSQRYRTISFIGQGIDDNPKGQQMLMWLPAGTYDVIELEEITVSDRGECHTCQSVRLHNAKGHVFYVSCNQFSEETLLAFQSQLEQDNSF